MIHHHRKLQVGLGVGLSGLVSFASELIVSGSDGSSRINSTSAGFGQRWTTTDAISDLGRIKLNMYRNGDASITGNLSLTIRSVVGGVASSVIATSSNAVDVSTLPGSKPTDFPGVWEFSGVSLSASTDYVISWVGTGISFGGAYLMSARHGGSLYASGEYQYSSNTGASWTAHPSGWDIDFAVDKRV